MIMSVYGRFFKLYLYTAIAPIPLSAMADKPKIDPVSLSEFCDYFVAQYSYFFFLFKYGSEVLSRK